MSAMATSAYEWADIDWAMVQRRVYKLQRRIFKASSRGAVKTVHKLQRLLMSSWSAKCLAVRKVTQDNRGKKTAGVDGIKSLSPHRRVQLVALLHLKAKAKPTRRVWIPKPGSTEKRGLGIPVMGDRAGQALVKLALEPEWEAHFEPNSYGFRPGRSCHDAIAAIHSSIQHTPKYVLDADLAKCFDRINHQALLEKLHSFPALRRTIKGWLKAGVMDGVDFSPTPEGTPQGGVASPLLANIALHGLEAAITSAFPLKRWNGRIHEGWKAQVIRYADDLVILHRDLGVIEQCRVLAAEWLQGMGLELKPSKTRITHTLREHDGNVGFDFLGFNIRQHPVGRKRSSKQVNGQPLGFITIVTPSKEARQRHLAAIRDVVRKNRAASQARLIDRLNPVIEGWAHYYAKVNSYKTFHAMDHHTFLKLRRWANRRHPKKSKHWVAERYWHITSEGKWDFHVTAGPRLRKHTQTSCTHYHVKVRDTKSAFDGDWAYWATRLGRHPELPQTEARLLKRQNGRCRWCGLLFTSEDVLEIDHIVPLVLGGKDTLTNKQLLHGHCHDAKTTTDGSRVAKGTRDNRAR
jgi:RNA-directed DNA polymerase